MIFSTDMDAPEPGREVLMYYVVGANVARALVMRQWKDEGDGTRVLRWVSSWNGEPPPADWAPYAWCDPEVPDPAADVL